MLGFVLGTPVGSRRLRPCGRPRPAAQISRTNMCAAVRSADVLEFFKHRVGRWRSRRVTHHLAFRRAERGESEISMSVLEPTDERIIKLCELHKVDPALACGGCHVTWEATMAWDQEGENHEGETVFALVPDTADRRSGKMLRDRGYAEIVPVAGQYTMTDEDELYLETPYDGGAVEETFAFDGINMCNRVSNVRRFGGIATATFSTEERLDVDNMGAGDNEVTEEELKDILSKYTLFGTQTDGEMSQEKPLESNFLSGSRERFASAVAASKSAGSAPSSNSAFESGFSARAAPPTPIPAAASTTADPRAEKLAAAAQKAGIDLSKIPPSMRVEFERSFDLDNKE